ncbi:MAG: hypothetical protein K5785_00935 [Nitrosarchaeum sp.]|nr:hypothetical protein [Nitrosarchaeum sp.]
MIEEPPLAPKKISELTLDPKQVSQLIKDGINLDDSGNHMYVMRFGWNNEFNKAADPKPFKIQKHLNEKLRKDALGMPYVIPPFGEKKHIRKLKDVPEPITIEEQLRAILEAQSNYAIGEIQGSLEYPSGNVWLIIDIWPEFQAGVERGYYPPLVSPTFNFTDVTPDGIVNDAQFLNLQAVSTSGYDAEYTQIAPVCKNGIKECMAELKVYGAAGTLRKARISDKSFSSTIQGAVGSMSSEGNSTPSLETVAKDLDATKQELMSLQQTVGGMNTKLEAIATKVGVNTKDNPPGGNPGVSGAAGQTTVSKEDFDKMKSELDALKKSDSENTKLVKQMEKERQDAEQKLKEAHVNSILERKLRGKKVTDDEKKQLKEEYLKKDIDVLETLDNELKAAIPEPSSEGTGISGAYGMYKPDLTFERKDRPKNSEIMEAVN